MFDSSRTIHFYAPGFPGDRYGWPIMDKMMSRAMRPVQEPPPDKISLNSVLYALSDPVRADIVLRIAENGEQACGQCGVEMPKSSLSHHFKVLREAGIISTRIEGTRHIIALRRSDLNKRFPGLLNSIIRAARTERLSLL